jgi:hypothetical protein
MATATAEGVPGRRPGALASRSGVAQAGAVEQRSQYRNQGERVASEHHLMQAESDIFIGWTHVVSPAVKDGTAKATTET